MRFRLKDLSVIGVHPTLDMIAHEIKERFDLTTITCGKREGDPSVHGTVPLRALDIRCRDLCLGECVENWINELWEYDPSRPDKAVCWCHDTGQGMHLHLQVHPKTRRRSG